MLNFTEYSLNHASNFYFYLNKSLIYFYSVDISFYQIVNLVMG